MAKFGAVFNSDVKKTDNRPRSETRWIHYTKLIDNTDQHGQSSLTLWMVLQAQTDMKGCRRKSRG